MVTCLENVSRQERKEEIVRNEFSRDDQYSATHEAALSGGKLGRGTGNGRGHTHWLPNCKGTLGTFNFSNFDTNPKDHIGTDVDNATRETAMVRSLYNYENQYSARIVDTSLNVREGQYRVP